MSEKLGDERQSRKLFQRNLCMFDFGIAFDKYIHTGRQK